MALVSSVGISQFFLNLVVLGSLTFYIVLMRYPTEDAADPNHRFGRSPETR